MNKLLYIISTTLCGGLGWWLGEQIGVMSAFLLGVVGTAAGVYLAHRIIRNYFE